MILKTNIYIWNKLLFLFHLEGITLKMDYHIEKRDLYILASIEIIIGIAYLFFGARIHSILHAIVCGFISSFLIFVIIIFLKREDYYPGSNLLSIFLPIICGLSTAICCCSLKKL